MNPTSIDTQRIWQILAEIPDPEIPVISIAELGVLRKVETEGERIIVYITPTYSGCPAMNFFEIGDHPDLGEAGISPGRGEDGVYPGVDHRLAQR